MSFPSNRLTKFAKIPFWSLVSDLFFVARGLWFFLLFDVLIFVFFIVLPQGKDILLSIIENTGKDFWWTILFLVLGTVFWGMVAEFGARYTLYVTDNSGDSLSDERVEWRKLMQRSFAGFSLYYPPLIIMAGLAIAAFGAYSVGELVSRYEFFVTLGLFCGVFALLYHLYSGVLRKRGWLRLPKEEDEWVSKLYGIYNPFVFMYPADEALQLVKPVLTVNPWNPEQQDNWEAEEGKTGDEAKRQVEHWPKTACGADGKHLVNGRFEFYRFSKKRDDVWARWFYRIPLHFLKDLHFQLLVFVSVCVTLVIFFSVIHNTVYQAIGAAGLVAFAFGCWCGVYIGVLFLDKAPLKLKLPYRLLLFIWLLVCSWYNNDHPVRISSTRDTAWKARPALAQHFTDWFQDYHKRYYPSVSVDSNGGKIFPVLFVCAEGGACRTGAFTSMMLAKLQERYHTLNDRIYAYSSVSGGSLGVGFYNAITNFRQPADSAKENDSVYTQLTKDFFSRDHLAAALGKLFFCEVIQLFWPVHNDGFDRAVALERAWEDGYGEVAAGKGGPNLFDSDYYSVFASRKSYPAWFINTTCVETGMQCWVSNVLPDDLMPQFSARDVWRNLKGTTRYSTAINFSSRFPLVSPAAGVGERDPYRRHYVDGGYFENLGAQTMADVLHALAIKDSALFSHVRPVVLVLEYSSHNDPNPKGLRFGNEWSEILGGIYGTRDGRGEVALSDLQYLTEKVLGGRMIELPLDASGTAVPLNWLLSKRSMDNVSAYCDTVVAARNTPLVYLENILDTTGR